MTARSILLFGGGRMGLAMLRGWVAGGFDPAAISIIDPAPRPELEELARQWGCDLNAPLSRRLNRAIVVAVKPQMAPAVSDAVMAAIAADSLLISIMAGKTLADLGRLFPGASASVRAIPNLPAAIGRGVTVAIAGPDCSASQYEFANDLLSGTGLLEWFADEEAMDIATALSGSGPGYIFYIADCLIAAGVDAGLSAAVSERLVRSMLAGSGAMLEAVNRSAADLRRDVTSPAGTTEAGLRVLMGDGRLQALLTGTVAAARDRARELAG